MKPLPYLFLLPAVLGFLLTVGAPLLLVGQLSLTRTNYVTSVFVGLSNFQEALSDAAFLRTIFNSMLYVVAIVPVQIAGAVAIAFMVLDAPKRIRDAARFVFYVPSFAAGIVLAKTWRWMFSFDGIVNQGLKAAGIKPVLWLLGRGTGITAVSVAIIMATVGIYMIIVLGGMMAVPREVIEQARIDGASHGQVRARIILPMVAPTIALVSTLGTLGVLQMWETARYLTAGSPMGGTATMAMDIVSTGFEAGKHGLAAAKGVIMIAIVGALALVKRRIEG